ncbi:MAG TPA: cellulase family glycosylhydrolase [Verrucomicrobiae bacterium]
MKIIPACLLAFSLCAAAQAQPLSLHPENPHYFQFRGKPTIILTSGEHYGAVLNLDFDYRKYLQALAADGLNNTRVFTGSYVEPQGAFNIARNTLAPEKDKFIAPWARSSTPGYPNGGNKFDLSKWDEKYFARLKDFMAEADKNGVIVEMNLFCPFYEEPQWQLSPQNAANNINNVGNVPRTNVYTLDKHGGLLAIHEAMTRKIVTELNQFDNLYYEICNEPYFGGVTLAWQHHIAQVIADTEKKLPRKHLISRNVANGSANIDQTHPAVQVYNFHYAFPPDAIAQNHSLNKPIGDNETGFKGTNDTHYRMEAWAFITAGGALYNNLDYSFVPGHEDGTFVYPSSQPGGGNPAFRKHLAMLREFIYGFDFIHMKPMRHDDVIKDVSSTGVGNSGANRSPRIYVLAKEAAEYAIYFTPIQETRNENGKKRETFLTGKRSINVELAIPGETYAVQWWDPVSGKKHEREPVISNGRLKLRSPEFTEDIALSIRKP